MSAATLRVRPVGPRDHRSVERILDATFDRPAEARLVTALRDDQVLTLELLGFLGRRPVGFLGASPVTLEPARHEDRLTGIGPVAVLPDYQYQGVGSALLQAAMAQLREAGHDAAVVLGHPDYYHRFGFHDAREFGLHCTFRVPPEVFMVCPFQADVLANRSGTIHYRPEFDEV